METDEKETKQKGQSEAVNLMQFWLRMENLLGHEIDIQEMLAYYYAIVKGQECKAVK